MKANTKGAIGLSVNILVIVIISLVVLGAGVALLYEMVGGAIEKKEELDSRTKQELQRLLIDEGKRVALPLHIASIYAGKNHVFGIGILNVEAVNDHFKLSIELDKTVDEVGTVITSEVNTEGWVLYYPGELTIKQSEHHTEPIMVDVPGDAKKGKYIFNVKVVRSSNNSQYGNTQKFIVNVK